MSSHPFLHGCAMLTLAAELESAQNDTTVYTAEIENDTESVELEYAASGEILSMTFEQDRKRTQTHRATPTRSPPAPP